MTTPTISIITPVYNTEKFIQKCLQSLQNQSFQNIEIICIDDQSTDDSKKIIEQIALADPRIKLISTAQQSGSSSARNKGIEKATGTYLMFCDSDDSYEPEMCELMLATIESKNVDLVMCNSNIITHDGERIGADESHQLKIFGIQLLNTQNKMLIGPLIWNKIFKKNIVDQYNIRFPSGTNGGDMAFVAQYLGVIKNVYGIPQRLYNYMTREGSVIHNILSKKNEQGALNRLNNYPYLYQFFKKHNLLEQNIDYFAKAMWHEIHWLQTTYNTEAFLRKLVNYGADLLADYDLSVIAETKSEKKQLENIKNRNYDYFHSVYFGADTSTQPPTQQISQVKILGLPLIKTIKSAQCSKIYFLGIKVIQIKCLNHF